MAFFAPLIPVVIGALVSAAASLAGAVLIGLGIGLVSYIGFNELLQFILETVQAKFAVLPPQVITIMIKLKVDVCISILTSAGMIRMGLSGLRSGSVKKWVTK
jgi:hypothetical protein